MFHLLKVVLRAQEQMQRLVYTGASAGAYAGEARAGPFAARTGVKFRSELEMVFMKLI